MAPVVRKGAGSIYMRKFRGFTLIELLVTIAVAIILATVAVPGFQRMMAVSHVASDYNEVLSGIRYARSEAIKKRRDVTFTVSHSKPWEYKVSDSGDLRVRTGRDERTWLNKNFAVTFGSLGKPTGSCSSGCTLTLSNTYSEVGDRTIKISPMGRAGGGS